MTLRLILVDDQADLRELLAMCLVPEFRVVAEAGIGQEAVDVVRDKDTDLVVMDLSMPDMDGLEAIRAIRQEAAVRIAVLSGFRSDRLEQAARDHGAVAYIEKGLPLDELKRRLAEAADTDPPPVQTASEWLRRRVRELV